MSVKKNNQPILLIGDGKLPASIYVCLVNAGYTVDFYTGSIDAANKRIEFHNKNTGQKNGTGRFCKDLAILSNSNKDYKAAIIITPENLIQKKLCLQTAEKNLGADTPIAINTESIALSEIQANAIFPERVFGVNWSEPAHTTHFLEIICNDKNNKELADTFCETARSWNKDSYLVTNDYGIRSRMMCAMIREAFYLVENGYVSIEDIDRACRNDAGFYLPFAGNFRYMDLMGTYMYGIVMRDLNPELSTANHVPEFFENIIQQGGEGMENKKGIYPYQNGDTEKWDNVFGTFSYEIKKIIEKYSLKNKEVETTLVTTEIHE